MSQNAHVVEELHKIDRYIDSVAVDPAVDKRMVVVTVREMLLDVYSAVFRKVQDE